MYEPALAIDFGTSRTKVAWRDAEGTVHTLHFDGVPYVPSLFYLPTGSNEILLGQEAYTALEDDPLGVVTELKRAIQRHATIRVTEDRQVDPQALLAHLFHTIKQRALAEIADFGGISPEQVWLTVPGNASETMETLLKRAARAVGWDMAQVVHEPVAAARYWLYGEGQSETPEAMVVVLDVGGGTTDWALLQRTGNRIHRAEQCAPGAVSVGGTDVDRALSDWVRERHPALCAAWPEPRLRDRLRLWKEAMLSSNSNPVPVRIKGQPLELDGAVLDYAYHRVLLDKILPSFEAFLKPIVAQYPAVPILLVGGGATALLEKAVSDIHPHVHCSQDPIGAVIQGALVTAAGAVGTQEQAQRDASGRQQREDSPAPADSELIPSASNAKELTVAKNGPAHCRTISDALTHIVDGGVITILAGHYQESLEIDKSVTLIGEDAAQVCIQAIDSRVIAMTNATVMMRGLTIHGINVGSKLPEDCDQALRYCVSGEQSVLSAEHCRIFSDSGNGLFLRGTAVSSSLRSCEMRTENTGCALAGSARLTIEKCALESGFMAIHVTESCQASLMDSQVEGERIYVTDKANCDVQRCQVKLKYSVSCSKNATVSIEDSDIASGEEWPLGVINMSEKASVKALKTKFSGGSAMGLSDNARLNAKDCQFRAEYDHGHGINCSDNASVQLLNCGVESIYAGLSVSDESRVELRDCRIQSGSTGIGVSDKAKGTIQHVQLFCAGLANSILGDLSTGIDVGGTSALEFDSCVINGYRRGVTISDEASPRLRSCTFISSASVSTLLPTTGIAISDASTAEIESCQFQGYEYGADISDKTAPRIKKCTFTGSGTPSDRFLTVNTGIRLADTSKADIENCEITEYECGIESSDEAEPRIAGCKLMGIACEGRGGIRIADSSKARIRRCEITGYDWGVVLHDEANPGIYDCKITRNTIGLGLWESASVTLEGCDLRGNSRKHSHDESSATIRQSNNRL